MKVEFDFVFYPNSTMCSWGNVAFYEPPSGRELSLRLGKAEVAVTEGERVYEKIGWIV